MNRTTNLARVRSTEVVERMVRSSEKITLDLDTFKILASETRIALLKALDGTQKTVTDLSRDLDLNKSTLHQHLGQLCTAGLVKRLGGAAREKRRKPRPNQPPARAGRRKWVYYKLTWKGRSILHPERVTIAVLLSIFVVGGLTIALLVAIGPGAFHGPGGHDPDPALDTRAPVFTDFDLPPPFQNTTGPEPYTASVRIVDDPGGETVSGVDPFSIEVRAGFGPAPATDPHGTTVTWLSKEPLVHFDAETGRATVRLAADGFDLDAARGGYLWLEWTAADRANTTNSTRRAIYLPLASDPDIAIDAAGITRGDGWNEFMIWVMVANRGSANVSAVQIDCYGADPDRDGDGRLDARFLPDRERLTVASFQLDLAAGETMTAEAVIDGRKAVMAGPWLYAVADPHHVIPEADETNNALRIDADELYRSAQPSSEAGGEAASADSPAPGAIVVVMVIALLALANRYRPSRR